MDKYTKWEDIPEHLVTRKKLKDLGFRLARGQLPVAEKVGGFGPFNLYDVREAVKKLPPTEAQLAAIQKAMQQKTINSRCAICKVSFQDSGYRRIKIKNDTGNGSYICEFCRDRRRASELAQKFLATEGAIILDTETTGLDETAQIVEIAIINVAGETLLDTLVKPTILIPADTSRIHGITDADVDLWSTWAEIDPIVTGFLLDAPAIAIYNAQFDLRMINQSRAAVGLLPNEAEKEILEKTKCAMAIYAIWFGEWSFYHKSYKWQSLEGGTHRALGDCLATLERIKEMAE